MSCLKVVVRQGNVLKWRFLLFVLLVVSLLFSAVAYAQSGCRIVAYEGTRVVLDPAAYDPDPEIGPAGTLIWEFGPPFDSQGIWQSKKGQRGIFPFWVSVSDGEYKDTRRDCVELLPYNSNPVLLPLNEVYVTRGQLAKISASCYDPDGDPVEISYKFMGRSVAYIQYEPPGVYAVEAICTDGFGGVDSERTKLHILMEQVIEEQRPKTVFVPPSPPAAPTPAEIELVLPGGAGNDSVELAPECVPCPTIPQDNIEVVVYDSIHPLTGSGNTGADNRTGAFVIESPPKAIVDDVPVVKDAVPKADLAQQVILPKRKAACDTDLARKADVSRVLGRCC